MDDQPFNEEDPLIAEAEAHGEEPPEVVQAVAVLGTVRALEPVRVGPAPPLRQSSLAVAPRVTRSVHRAPRASSKRRATVPHRPSLCTSRRSAAVTEARSPAVVRGARQHCPP